MLIINTNHAKRQILFVSSASKASLLWVPPALPLPCTVLEWARAGIIYSFLQIIWFCQKSIVCNSVLELFYYAGQQAEIEVHRFADCDQPSGHVHQGSFSAMSPSLETGYSFGPTSSVPGQWSQDQCADTRENYADLCFSQSKMNGSQPCLASEPKVSRLLLPRASDLKCDPPQYHIAFELQELKREPFRAQEPGGFK